MCHYFQRLRAAALVLAFAATTAQALAQAPAYSISRQYNGFWEEINAAGELGGADINVSINGGPPFSEAQLKYGNDLKSFGREEYDITTALSPATWPQGWSVRMSSDRKLLIQHCNFNNPIDDQYETGGSIFDEATQTLTRLDPSSRSSWFMDRSESGYVVGYRDKTGLGQGSGQENFYKVTSVALAISPSGTITEVPHPEGQYGFAQQEEFPYDIIYDNEAILTGVNEAGLACGTGWKEGPDASFNYAPEGLSFTYDIPSGTTKIIPDPFLGYKSIRGASDINERGEVVGVAGNGFRNQFWIYLPAPNYGLQAGTHIIYEQTDGSESGWRSQRDWRGRFLLRDVRINNRGQVIFPVYFPGGDKLSLRMWDAGTLRSLTDLNPDSSLQITSSIDINDAGQILVGVNQTQTRIMSPSPLSITVDPSDPILKIDDTYTVSVKLQHTLTEPATYEFLRGPLELENEFFEFYQSEEDLDLPDGQDFAAEPPFELSASNSEWTFMIPVVPTKNGVTPLYSEVKVTSASGDVQTVTANLDALIEPIEVEFTVVKEQWALNQVSEEDWGERSKEVQKKRREDIANDTAVAYFTGTTNDPEPFRNLLEVEMKLTNKSKDTIDRISIPGVNDILSLIQSTDTDNLGVPLFPVRYYSHGGFEDDLTISSDNRDEPDLTLLEEGTATFAWVFEAYDANADPLVDDSANLEFNPLILGRVLGNDTHPDLDLRIAPEQKIDIIDKPLLKWGIRPKDGRVNYLSGQVVRVQGFLENVSGDEGNAPRDILVMMYPIQDGNLGGGFAKKRDASPDGFPDYYEIFELPGEGDGKRIDIDSVFISFPAVAETSGTARYGIRTWLVNEDDTITSADGQAVVDPAWSDEFEVTLAPNRPLLSDEDQRRQECAALGISPFLCGIEEGTLDFTKGIYGLGQFLFSVADGNANLYRGIIAYEMLVAKNLFDAAMGDPDARKELYQASYDKYVELVNLKVMVGEGLDNVPMAFDAFVNQSGDAMSGFFDAAFAGDLEEVQFQMGRFLGANPDLLLEPLAMGMTYQRLLRSAKVAEARVVNDVIAAQRKSDFVRQNQSINQRLAAAKANPGITDLSSALLAGDRLSNRNLLEIFGIDSDQLKALKKIASDNQVMLSFRSRSALARDLLARKLAWPKPQRLKFKTVNEIDIKYLNYPIESQAILEIIEPPKALINKTGPELETALDQYMDTMVKQYPELTQNDVLFGEVRSRLKTRTEEWADLAPELKLNPEGVSTIEIPTNFEADLQFGLKKERDRIPDIAAKQKRKVKTTLDGDVIDPAGGERRKRWTLDMSDSNGGNFKPVSGDVDFMAILEPNGSMILDADRRLTVYKQLAEAVDMQHGESFTFFIDKARKKYLDGNTFGEVGAEALCTISPFGDQTPTAAFFVKSLSIMEGANHKFLPVREKIRKLPRLKLSDGKIILEKGKTIVTRRPDVTGEYVVMAGAQINSRINLDFVNRFRPQIIKETHLATLKRLAFYLSTRVAESSGVEDGSETYARPDDGSSTLSLLSDSAPKPLNENAPPLLQVSNNPETGFLEPMVWTEGTGWSFVTGAEAIALGDPGILDMLPMTFATSPIERGASVFEIASLEELQAKGSFFKAGDRIVIAPGTEEEEFATLRTLSPFTLAAGAVFEHPTGVTIATLGPDNTDRDGDGLTGIEEIGYGTNPDAFDSDRDGKSDGDEIAQDEDPLSFAEFKLNAFSLADSRDALTFSWDATPNYHYSVESSPDLAPDSWATYIGTSPSSEIGTLDLPLTPSASGSVFYRMTIAATDDSDGDGLSAREEQGLGTSIDSKDTDGDGTSDGIEIYNGTDPLDSDSNLRILSQTYDELNERHILQFTSVPNFRYRIESVLPSAPGVWKQVAVVTSGTSVTSIAIPADELGEDPESFRITPLH
ncbi:hypothetical protein [Pelagicoccus sp. SDUM812005]|uniref:hypothetical protein n=1 Tax=Pelagicoccus sp. SDUM812005 TaxID=3041257 RepID=UPI00281228F9|nr:hypothetical protein [Pelagicoccus sp. SDUM812005]